MESDSRRLSDRGRYPDGVDGIAARFISLRTGLRVRVVESGSRTAFPIVLVPGWGCGAWIFHETMLPLAACGFHAIAVELALIEEIEQMDEEVAVRLAGSDAG